MKTTCVFVMALALAAPALAQTPARPLRDRTAIDALVDARWRLEESPRSNRPAERLTPPQAPTSTPADPWPKRHAVLLGALVGFGSGFVIGAKTCNYPTAEGGSCDDYTYPANAQLLGGFYIGGFGAAIGAGVGAIIRAVR